MKTRAIQCAAAAAVLCATAFSAQAATVQLSGWAFGAGSDVATNRYSGQAGGFMGSLGDVGTLDTASFITYCIELEESFSFSNSAMTGYALTAGGDYFQTRRGDAAIAERLGQLFTYVADHSGSVNTSLKSSALQLAVWNMVYDTDFSLTTSGSFRSIASTSGLSETKLDSLANGLLAGAQGTLSRFDVFALERSGSQDFIVLVPRGEVPEPGSLALAFAAFGGLAWAGRGRRAVKASVSRPSSAA